VEMKIGDWEITPDEREDMEFVTMSNDEAADFVWAVDSELNTQIGYAVDSARNNARNTETPQYVLIRINF
jgi:hypothetical protein